MNNTANGRSTRGVSLPIEWGEVFFVLCVRGNLAPVGESLLQEREYVARQRSSPSPRPSPSGRGSIVGRSWTERECLDLIGRGVRFSLSLGERVGVRGNEAPGNLQTSSPPKLSKNHKCPPCVGGWRVLVITPCVHRNPPLFLLSAARERITHARM